MGNRGRDVVARPGGCCDLVDYHCRSRKLVVRRTARPHGRAGGVGDVAHAPCAVIQAIYRQNAAALLRTFLVNLPIALLFTGVAVELVRVGMVVTDAMSARFMAASGVDTRHLLAPVWALPLAASTAAPGFAVFLASGLVAGTAMVLWVELVVRAAAITAASLFLPLVLAALVWPSIGHWARRLADTLAALVLSKLVIAAVMSLAVGAVEGGLTEQGSVGDEIR